MPIHVPPITRRSFLAGSAAAVGGCLVPRFAWAADGDTDPNRFALLADTHVPERPDIVSRDTNMTANLKQVVEELVSLQRKPAGVIVNGDCAHIRGLPGDYANLAAAVEPLGKAGLPLHLTMGNHDDRGPFYEALARQRPADPPVESKHVGILSAPHANLFLLDSLREVNVVTGELGDAQLAWLAAALKMHRDKPAIVVVHHHPQFEAPPEGQPWVGLKDATALFKLLEEQEHVKAYVYGHTHNWALGRHAGIHLINLPPVAYVWNTAWPNGWVDAQLTADGVQITLRTIDSNHRQNHERHELKWR